MTPEDFDGLALGTEIIVRGRGAMGYPDGEPFEIDGPYRGISDGMVVVGEQRARLRFVNGWKTRWLT